MMTPFKLQKDWKQQKCVPHTTSPLALENTASGFPAKTKSLPTLSHTMTQIGRQAHHSFLNPLPFTDSKSFWASTPAQQNYLVADCIAAQVARESAITQNTHKDKARSWDQWSTYCIWVGLFDPFLEDLPCPAKIKLLGALSWQYRKLAFQNHLMSNWLMAQLQEPSHMYVRPSASMADPTHPWTMMASLDSFYNGN